MGLNHLYTKILLLEKSLSVYTGQQSVTVLRRTPIKEKKQSWAADLSECMIHNLFFTPTPGDVLLVLAKREFSVH